MPRSNESISRAIGETLNNYYSKYTGEEVEQALANASQIMPFIDTNIAIPAASFTGDYMTTAITTLSRGIWLHAIALTCVRAFSHSSNSINYEISLSTGDVLVAIPNDFMRDEGNSLIYYIDREIATGTAINMVCSSTRAYGEVTVKLITN